MIVERLPEVQALSEDEKLQLVAELFQEVAGTSSAHDATIFATLDERMKDLEARPESAVPWEEGQAEATGAPAVKREIIWTAAAEADAQAW